MSLVDTILSGICAIASVVCAVAAIIELILGNQTKKDKQKSNHRPKV